MATIIDAMAATLGASTKHSAREAAMIWQALSRMAEEWNRAVRSVGEGAGEAAALLVKLRADALALLGDAAEGLGLHDVVRSIFAAAMGLKQVDQAAVTRLPGRRIEEELASAAMQRNADAAQADGIRAVRTMPETAGAVGSFHGLTANFAAPREGGWQNALLALGALKVLSSTESLLGLAVALRGISASFDDADGDASGVANPGMDRRGEDGVALQVSRNKQASLQALGRAGAYASAAIAQARESAFSEARLQGGGSDADGAEAWSPSRLPDFDRAFGIGSHQSKPEQRLVFADWKSHSRRPAVQHKPADTQTPQLIEVAMNRYLGIEQFEDAEAVGHQGMASVGATLQDRSLDDVAQSGGAAASIALAAQGSAVTGLTGTVPASSTTETHIHGAITLVTQAMDGPAIARELAGMGRSQSLIQQGNSGIF
jgi:hypothetical protein